MNDREKVEVTVSVPRLILELHRGVVNPDGVGPVIEVKAEGATWDEAMDILKAFFVRFVSHNLAMSEEFEKLNFKPLYGVPAFDPFTGKLEYNVSPTGEEK